MTQIIYTRQGDYLLPNLLPPQEPQIPLGKYASMRRRFLQQSRKVTYTNLLTTGQLHSHLMDIEQTARSRVESIVSQMAQAAGVTEELKATDQMKWVGLMNNFRTAAEEQILQELIYA